MGVKGKNILLRINNQTLPRKDKRAEKRPNEDTDDNIPVEIHSKQHDEIRDGELEQMQGCADELLDECWTDDQLVSVEWCWPCPRRCCCCCCCCGGSFILILLLWWLLLVAITRGSISTRFILGRLQ